MKDIEFGKIIKRSWEVTRKNKWLWVLGLVLTAFGGASSSGGSSSGSSSNNVSNLVKPSPTPTPGGINYNLIPNVQGVSTDAIKSWFTSIPVQTWILIGATFIVFVIFTTVIVWVLTSWAKGALIGGFEDADAEKETNLKSFSKYGFAKIKDLIVFRLISAGICLGLVIALIIIIGLGFLIRLMIPVLGTIWLVLFGIVGVLAFIVAIFLISMLGAYAERLIVLKNFSPWNAWKKGLSLSKGNLLPTFLMGLINSAIGCASGCVGLIATLIVFALPAILLIYPIFKNGLHFPSIGQIVGIVILFILFTLINNLIRAIFTVFNYGTWNLLFRQILEKEAVNE